MRFGPVPDLAKKMRPWARPTVIGPPRGHESHTGSLDALIDDRVEDYGHAIRFYIQFENDELERLQNGGVIEMSLYSTVMYPVSAAMIGGEVTRPDNEGQAVEIDKTVPETQEKEVVESTPEYSPDEEM